MSHPSSRSTAPPNTAEAADAARRALRKPSPGLLARMKLLDLHRKRVDQEPPKGGFEIGRIPEDQLRQLDLLHKQDLLLHIERRGRSWSALRGSHITAQSTADRETFPSDSSLAARGSDCSSIVSAGDRLLSSDHDNNDDLLPAADALEHLPETAQATGPLDEIPEAQDGQDAAAHYSTQPLSRTASIYTLSRLSFTNQIQQLTSIRLPDACSLQASISAIPTSKAASSALNDAALQIRVWISKASDVLNGLDAEDDVDWASSAGIEGLDQADSAIDTFEMLISVFVNAIEELRTRPDIVRLAMADLTRLVDQMEIILDSWTGIKSKLCAVKKQVEIAMEWEELWSTVLGDIRLEVDALGRLVFEMEERRHYSVMAETIVENGSGLDIESLETIVEETPPNASIMSPSRHAPRQPITSPSSAPASPEAAPDESNLLALFARMQPLRASLDFLPMRLAQFRVRAHAIFPTACSELDHRRGELEDKWTRLERDADSLHRELGEDKWVLVFRNAGNQAAKMCQSVRRSLDKLRDALDDGEHMTNLPATAKKMESFEAKRMHYGPAIDRVLAIIDKGVKDRLTVNGEVLRLQSGMRREWTKLEEEMRRMQARVDSLHFKDTDQLRDSVSTTLSTERSFSGSADTPGSSPTSSIVILSRREDRLKSRQSSFNSNMSAPSSKANKRLHSMPSPCPSVARKPPLIFSRSEETIAPNHRCLSTMSPLPTPPIRRTAPTPPPSIKPRWNTSTNTEGVSGHNINPVATTPSARDGFPKSRSIYRVASHSQLPRSSFSRQVTPTPPLGEPCTSRPASAVPVPSRRISLAPSRTPSHDTSSRQATRAMSSSGVSLSAAAIRRRSNFPEPVTSSVHEVFADTGHSGARGLRKRLPAAGATAPRRASMLPQPSTPRPGKDRPRMDGERVSGVDAGADGSMNSSGARNPSRQSNRANVRSPRWRFGIDTR